MGDAGSTGCATRLKHQGRITAQQGNSHSGHDVWHRCSGLSVGAGLSDPHVVSRSNWGAWIAGTSGIA